MGAGPGAGPAGEATVPLDDPEALRALAGLAQVHDRPAVAAPTWEAVLRHHPDDVGAAQELARAREALGDAEGAAAVLATQAARPDTADPAALWLEAARLRTGAARREALVQAVEAGCLHPGTYARALDLDPEDPGLAARWAHLRRVLGGETCPEAAPFAARDALDAPARDALLPPSLEGWLAPLGDGLLAPALPDRAELVRGLEPLATAHPDAADVVADLAARLRIAPPEVFVFRGPGDFGLATWPTTPPAVLLGAAHLPGGARALAPAPLRWALAVPLALLAAGHPALESDPSLVGTSRQLYRVFGRYAGLAEDAVDLLTLVPGVDHLARLERLLRATRRVFAARKAVDKASRLASPWVERRLAGPAGPRGLGPTLLGGARLRAQLHADRIALALTGDLGAAVEALLLTSPAPPELGAGAAGGLAALLAGEAGLRPDEVVRLTSLVGWAARA
ncbi:MAG: hypothetical protein H6732_10815 [Alphaproteobacteria bacterium]|nr:hypothetical protein [Alphaproteobacteria bacterium]